MATKVTPATLTVKVSETITLNGVTYGGTNTFKKTSCGQVDQRIMSVAHDSNINVVSLGSADALGVVVAANLKYFRVTNLDDTNFVSVIVYDSGAGHEIAIKVEPGSSLFFTTDDIYANDDSAVDFAGTLIGAEAIYLRADTAACDCEYICVTT
tara:strand:- start:607 stop:1068 length:462 start_codon:yes stop_codon:yes gene_type:complete